MGTRYTVKPRDSISKIAARHGLPSWRMVYNSPENADFRKKRPNPNLIQPGQKLRVPSIAGLNKSQLDAARQRGRQC